MIMADNVYQKLNKLFCSFKSLEQFVPKKDIEIVQKAYADLQNAACEVVFISTFSSGKSTLINAMLGKKLLPSKQEACTAMVTRVKNTGKLPFRAEVYDKDNKLLRTSENLLLTEMEAWNLDANVSEIQVFGKIPFVANEDIPLVLIDTPGSNNERDVSGYKKFFDKLKASSNTLIVYVMTGIYDNKYEYDLLRELVKSFQKNKTQWQDRFLFVMNKLDGRSEEDENLSVTLNVLRDYLRGYGIENPKIALAAALPAMNIRLRTQGELPKVDKLRTDAKIMMLNCADYLHLEKYAALNPGLQQEIATKLEKEQKDWTDDPDLNPETALVHTGIPVIEAVIRQYALNYLTNKQIKVFLDKCSLSWQNCQHYCELKYKREIANSKDDIISHAANKESLKELLDKLEERIGEKYTINSALDRIAQILQDIKNL